MTTTLLAFAFVKTANAQLAPYLQDIVQDATNRGAAMGLTHGAGAGAVGGAGLGALLQLVRRSLVADEEKKKQISLLNGAGLGAGLGAGVGGLYGYGLGKVMGTVTGSVMAAPFQTAHDAGLPLPVR